MHICGHGDRQVQNCPKVKFSFAGANPALYRQLSALERLNGQAIGQATPERYVRPTLVRDLNGNGTIDSGRELFGDQTVFTSGPRMGQTAAHGFEALRALDADANGVADGVFNASDLAYADLRVWRDLNQDGVSQSNELLGLAESGVVAINLTQTPTQISQGKSTFTKTVAAVDANGDPISVSTQQTVQNVNFTQNSFYREFADNPVVTAQAAALPQMQGAGVVRDLREAMSLGTAQATALTQQVSNFGSAITAQARQGLIDTLITQWGATSSLAEARVRTPDLGLGFLGASGSGGGGNVGGGTATSFFPTGRAVATFANADPLLYAKLTALERFNGIAIIERYAQRVVGSYLDPSTNSWRNYIYYTVVIEAPRRAFFEQAYDSLKASVYQSLYLQTAGKEGPCAGILKLRASRRVQARRTGCRRERPVKGKIIPKLGMKCLKTSRFGNSIAKSKSKSHIY